MKLVAEHGVPDWGQHRPQPADADCALLAEHVPRAPQAQSCADSPPAAGAAE
jgi:hypothetical protein